MDGGDCQHVPRARGPLYAKPRPHPTNVASIGHGNVRGKHSTRILTPDIVKPAPEWSCIPVRYPFVEAFPMGRATLTMGRESFALCLVICVQALFREVPFETSCGFTRVSVRLS